MNTTTKTNEAKQKTITVNAIVTNCQTALLAKQFGEVGILVTMHDGQPVKIVETNITTRKA